MQILQDYAGLVLRMINHANPATGSPPAYLKIHNRFRIPPFSKIPVSS